MKVTILQSNFTKALSHISRVVGTRTTLPVLSNVLITAQKGRIEFSATDLEIGIITSTIGKIEEEGEITLPARLLSDFISNNKDESIELTVSGVKANLKSAHFEANIIGISPEEFPKVPIFDADYFCAIKKDEFINVAKRVAIAPANDETRPVLAGIYFAFDSEEVTLAATDSYRLAEDKIHITNKANDRKMIVPTRTINEVIRLISSADDASEIKISATENQVSFKINDTYIVSRLIEGAFPNYAQIIPTSATITAVVDQSELLSAVKMSSLFAKESVNNNVKIKVGKDCLIVSSTSSQAGDAKSTIEAKTTGEEVEIAFNAKYLIDVLQVLPGSKISVNLTNANSAGAIRKEGDKDFLYIIMPLKIEG
ncbi:MAG: DNA polymerase III subunit beta [bacterium]